MMLATHLCAPCCKHFNALAPLSRSPCSCVEGCDENKCMSGDGQGGYDCWAGNGDPFSCADGLAAKKTGETHEWDGLIYERYTCCSGAWRCRRLIPHEAKSVPQYSLNSLNLLHPLLHCMGMIKHLKVFQESSDPKPGSL